MLMFSREGSAAEDQPILVDALLGELLEIGAGGELTASFERFLFLHEWWISQ